MDRQEAKNIVSILEDVFKKFEKEHNYIAKMGKSITYDKELGELRFRLTIKKEGTTTKEEQDLVRYANAYNLDTNKLGKTRDGAYYTLVGYNKKAPKYPFQVLNTLTGVREKITVGYAKELFSIEEKIEA